MLLLVNYEGHGGGARTTCFAALIRTSALCALACSVGWTKYHENLFATCTFNAYTICHIFTKEVCSNCDTALLGHR